MHQLIEPVSDIASMRSLATAIVRELFSMRRLLPGEMDRQVSFDDELAPHLPKILKAIERQEPVHMVLPAFPAKSPNRRKTLGHLPDYGEDVAFKNLNNLCERIERVYAGGAKMTICSDGRVFADIVRIPDQDVTDYNLELRQRYTQLYPKHIEFFDLDDVYPGVKDYATLREELMVIYGEPLHVLRERCKTETAAGEMYRGITRFLFEDYSGISDFKGMSKNAIQNHARLAAYRVIQRSNAWSRLLSEKMQSAVRLSIHPQFRISGKVGVNLIGAGDCWATPWHSVVLKSGGEISLIARHEAERRNAVLVFENGRPSYYQTLAV